MTCSDAVFALLIGDLDVFVGIEEPDVDFAHLLGEFIPVFGIIDGGVAEVFISQVTAFLREDVGVGVRLVDDGSRCHLDRMGESFV